MRRVSLLFVKTNKLSTHDIPKQMHAVLCTTFGSADELVADVAPVPKVGSGQLLVQVKHASINRIDCQMRNGYGRNIFAAANEQLPAIFGCDASGTVVDAGNSWSFREGDEVVVAIRPCYRGTHAQFIAVNELDVALKPQHLSSTEAAAFPFVACTALSALHIAVQHVRCDFLI